MSKSVRITMMMRTFLYLPIFVADELNLFRKHVPREYDVRLDHGRRNDSDADVYRRLMADTKEDSDIWFAVGDPMQVYEKGDVLERRPKVVASLIGKVSFWAVNHTVRINDADELPTRFREILAYDSGTTSHVVAQSICNLVPNAPVSIRSVPAGTELDELSNSSADVVAITPDLLGAIDKEESDGGTRFNICYPFSGTFSNMTVTALMTRDDIIRTEIALVRGVLLAIYEALSLIRMKDPRVLDAGAKALWCKRPIVERALKRALEEDLFPHELAVDRTAWRNAIEVYHDAIGTARPSSRAINDSFNRYVDRHPAVDILTSIILPRLVGRSAVEFRDLLYALAVFAVSAGGLTASAFITSPVRIVVRYLAVAAAVGAIYWVFARVTELWGLHRYYRILHCTSALLLFVLLTVGYDVFAGAPASAWLNGTAVAAILQKGFAGLLTFAAGLELAVLSSYASRHGRSP